MGAHCGVFDTDVLSRSQIHFRDREHRVEICVEQIAKKNFIFYFLRDCYLLLTCSDNGFMSLASFIR